MLNAEGQTPDAAFDLRGLLGYCAVPISASPLRGNLPRRISGLQRLKEADLIL